MSSTNFFSMLEDNTSSDVVEIAKKRLATQSKPAPKPAQPVAATEKKAPQTTGAQKPQQGDKPEKTQQRPQTSQENRGRGRGQQQRPQTAGGDSKGEVREGGRGRGQRREGGQRDGQQQRPRFDKPRVRKEGEGAVSAVDTTTDGDKKRAGKSHTHDANAPRRGRQFDRSVSGTGRGRGLKKGGEGAHNWGKEGDQDVRRGTRTFQDKKGRSEGKVVVKGEDAPVEGVTEPLKETEETVQTPVEGEAPKEGETKVEEKKKEEEVDNTLTLEEYQKQQQEKRKNLPNFRPESAPAATATATATTDKKKKEKKEKVAKVGEVQSIQEFLKDRAEELNKQREAERDSRGRGRGPRQSGRGRGGNKRQDAPNLKDEKAFPSLGSK